MRTLLLGTLHSGEKCPFKKRSLITIIDYGMGNLGSVAKAFHHLGGSVRVTSDPKGVKKAKALVFPGVGAFGPAMGELRRRRLLDPILGFIQEGKPFLGLCLGLQLLFASSEESPGVKGLAVFPGQVRRLPRRRDLKVPHVGWNQIERQKTEDRGQKSEVGGHRSVGLLEGVPDGAYMYFVHSYYADPQDKEVIAATTEYGRRFPSVVWNGDRLWATQFHPEKSQKWGLRVLNNFLSEVR